MLRTTPVIVAITGCLLVSGVMAQSTRERLTNLEARLARLERTVNNNDSQTDMLRKIQQLQEENQALRNEIETLQFDTVRSADRQRQLYLDLDQRLQALEAGSAPRVGAAPVPAAGDTAPAATGATSDQLAYQAAFDLLKQGRYEEATAGFKNFLVVYPASNLKDNAQYWLAETHYVSQDYETALEGFQEVVTGYPTSRKIPDAWLKIGYCNYEMQRWNDARQALSVVTSRFPETTAARLARQRLDMMESEGR
ncbi:MAG: tol-pal system protein YbgF [Gammaproteobacteria bacterium]|nr:tol-pal system protein YbgF [Gammaproteobacteria bacterium]